MSQPLCPGNHTGVEFRHRNVLFVEFARTSARTGPESRLSAPFQRALRVSGVNHRTNNFNFRWVSGGVARSAPVRGGTPRVFDDRRPPRRRAKRIDQHFNVFLRPTTPSPRCRFYAFPSARYYARGHIRIIYYNMTGPFGLPLKL